MWDLTQRRRYYLLRPLSKVIAVYRSIAGQKVGKIAALLEAARQHRVKPCRRNR